MYRTYKTEINPSKEQKEIINRTIGVFRFIYNFYISYNKEIYERSGEFISGMNFSKWLNNEYMENNPEKSWIREVSSKAVKQSIMNAETAFKKFFKKQSGFPRFKKKRDQDVKMYFVKTDSKSKIRYERHRIKIPTIGYSLIKEKGYIPKDKIIISGTVSQKAGRYYVSVLIDDTKDRSFRDLNEGMGIDLGINNFAVCSNIKEPFKNINKTKKVKGLEKYLKRQQRKLSRKYESLKKRNKVEEGEATKQNIQKQVRKVQVVHQKLNNIRENHINQVINKIVKTKPSYITIEDLNVKGMMKNRHLAKAIKEQKFYEFRVKLTYKCKVHKIELRIADRFYPSSKLCSKCGSLNKNLKLKDRIYKCPECSCEIDRDLNASINLANAKVYKIAK